MSGGRWVAAAFWTGLILAVAVPAGLTLDKELLLARGRTVYLELAPVDPRSLIQGDYMRLAYRLERDLPAGQPQRWPLAGRLVLAVDERGVGHFVTRHTPGRELRPGEVLLAYRRRDGRLRLGAEAFFFQEGEAERYARAEYGELVVGASGESILVGLADGELRPLGGGLR